jgi:hypothetical protein
MESTLKEVLEEAKPDVARAQKLTAEQAKVFVSKKLNALREYHNRGDYEELFRFLSFNGRNESPLEDARFWSSVAKKISEIFVVVSANEI